MWAVVAYGLALALPAASVLGVLVAFAIGSSQTGTGAAPSSVGALDGDAARVQAETRPLDGFGRLHANTAVCNATSAAALLDRRAAWSLDDNGSTPRQPLGPSPGSAVPLVTHRLCVDVQLPVALPGAAGASLSGARCSIACDIALHHDVMIEPQALQLQPEGRVPNAAPTVCDASSSAATA